VCCVFFAEGSELRGYTGISSRVNLDKVVILHHMDAFILQPDVISRFMKSKCLLYKSFLFRVSLEPDKGIRNKLRSNFQ